MSTINNDVLNRVTSDGVTAKNAIVGKSADQMDMNDFFKLLTAQMTNQDFMDPQSNTEYIAQMAQFTTLQGMQTIQEYQLSNYAVSYTGKDVTIATTDTNGDLQTIKGTVEKVTFYDGEPQVMVNGKSYPLYQIMEVGTDVTATNAQNAGNSLNLVAGYIGKTVTVTDTSNPEFPKDVTGEVTSVTLKGGVPYVIVGGKEYAYTAITSVGTESETNTNTGTTTGTETGTTTGTGTTTDKDTETETETETGTDTDTETETETGYDTDD